jgi:hypothetical protein
MVRAIRGVLLLVGLGVGLYGVQLLRDIGTDNLLATGRWLIGGVVLHDAVIAPATIALALVASRVLRGRVPAALVIGAVVVGTVTAVAIPVLGKPGARPDNPTLLDRDYAAGWWGLVGVTVLLVVAALVTQTITQRRRRARARG